MKVFLATAYTTKLDASGNVLPDFKQKIESIIDRYKKAGREVSCDAEQAHWRVTPDIDLGRALQLDFVSIKACDEFAALIDDTVSAGIQLEIGYAMALGKRITMITEKGIALNYTNQLLSRFQNITHLVI